MLDNFRKSPKYEGMRTMLTLIVLLALAFLLANNIGVIFSALGAVWDAFFPFVVGCAVAYVLNLLMVKWEKIYFPHNPSPVVEKTRRPVCILLSVVVILGIISIIVYFATSEVVDALVAIGNGFTSLMESAKNYLGTDSPLYPLIDSEPDAWSERLQSLITLIGGTDNIATALTNVGTNVASGVVNAIIAFAFAIYVLYDKENVLRIARNAIHELLSPKHYISCMHALRVANRCFGRFIYGQCFEACILGTLCAIGLALFDFPFAAPIGLIVGACSVVPIVGAWVGGLIGAIMIFSVSPQQVIFFVIFLVVLQQIESNAIYPKVVGTSVGVPGVIVLISVFVGGALFNVAGVLLAVPTVATVRTLLSDKQNKKKHTDAVSEEDYVVNMREVATSQEQEEDQDLKDRPYQSDNR